jgi:hypothetical protein
MGQKMAFLYDMSTIIHCGFCLLADDHGSGFFLFRRVLFILTRLCLHGTEGIFTRCRGTRRNSRGCCDAQRGNSSRQNAKRRRHAAMPPIMPEVSPLPSRLPQLCQFLTSVSHTCRRMFDRWKMTLQIAGKCGDSDRDAEFCQPFRQIHDADLSRGGSRVQTRPNPRQKGVRFHTDSTQNGRERCANLRL